MSKGLRWGFLSAGGIATAVAEDFLIAGLTIQAVGARDLDKANEFADRFSIPNRHQGYEALVNDPEVDVIYISTIHPFHKRDALLALNAGKHLLVEKPFTINAREAEEVRALAQAKGLFVMEAMWTRFLPSMDAIFEVINSGALGEIELFTADHSQALTHVPRLLQRDLGGGALLDLGIYPISMAHRIFGKPVAITAKARLNSEKVDATTSMIFEYDGDKQATMTTSFLGAGPVNASIIGSLARIDIDGSFYAQTSFRVVNHSGEIMTSYSEKIKGQGRQYQAMHVEKCVNEGLIESPVMSLAESVEIMKVMDAIRSQIGVTYPTE
jgi:predicted dehydrogenase